MSRLEEKEFKIACFVFELDLRTVFKGFRDGASRTVELEDGGPVGTLYGFEACEQGVFYVCQDGLGGKGEPSSFVQGRRTWFPSARGRGGP